MYLLAFGVYKLTYVHNICQVKWTAYVDMSILTNKLI